MMTQLSYSSTLQFPNVRGETLQMIRKILSVSRDNNARQGITGFLLIDGATCFQILEGEAQTVANLYRRIKADDRHGSVHKLGERPILMRDFSSWSMGSLIRDASHAGIFLNHGLDGRLGPESLNASKLLDLAMDLQAYEFKRELPE